MAQIEDSTQKPKPRKNCFLGCFGFSEKAAQKKRTDAVNPGGRKKNRWFFGSRFRMKKSDVKTVPVDITVPDKAFRSKQAHADKKISSKRHSPATGGKIPATVPDQSTPQKTRYESAQKIILEVPNNLVDVGSPKDDTCRRRSSFGRKIEAKKTGGSYPGSPETRSKPSRTISKLSHSSSFPQPKREKPVADAGGKDRKQPPESRAVVARFDPVVGLSIIVVTLIIMLIWGRLCAILCTSAWFYFVPRLRTSTGSRFSVEDGSNQKDSDLDYEEYKKKVVLEGFLERKHRNTMGRL